MACEAHQRDKLERLCRYVSRGPIALERLSIDGDGLVVLELKHPFRDGTTHVVFEPLDFIARLASLVPRPRAHLVRYHGLFAMTLGMARASAACRALPSRPWRLRTAGNAGAEVSTGVFIRRHRLEDCHRYRLNLPTLPGCPLHCPQRAPIPEPAAPRHPANRFVVLTDYRTLNR